MTREMPSQETPRPASFATATPICGIICGVERKQSMPAVMEAIDRMTTSEKFDAMSYLWSSLSMSGNSLVPDWHKRELAKTEARVAAGIERPIPWAAAKEIIKSAFS